MQKCEEYFIYSLITTYLTTICLVFKILWTKTNQSQSSLVQVLYGWKKV